VGWPGDWCEKGQREEECGGGVEEAEGKRGEEGEIICDGGGGMRRWCWGREKGGGDRRGIGWGKWLRE